MMQHDMYCLESFRKAKHVFGCVQDFICYAGVVLFCTYALIQASQAADATASFDVHDSDNYPQVSRGLDSRSNLHIHICTESVCS